MAAKRSEKAKEPTGMSGGARIFLAFANAFGKAADRLGVPTAILVLLLFVVWLMGDETTQNDFVRELLFGQVTPEMPVMRIFVGALVALIVLMAVIKREDKRSESAELRRVSAEKSRLQEKLTGKVLSHSNGQLPVQSANDAPEEPLREQQKTK